MEAYARADDDRALAEIHRRYAPLLLGLIRKRVACAEDAQDILQQTFLHVHRARDLYRSGAALKPWLCTVALNACRDHGRRRQRRPEVSAPMDAFVCQREPLAAREREQEQQRVLRSLMLLPEPAKELLRQHFLHERPFTELAPELGVKPGALRLRAFRGCRRLRGLLEASPAE